MRPDYQGFIQINGIPIQAMFLNKELYLGYLDLCAATGTKFPEAFKKNYKRYPWLSSNNSTNIVKYKDAIKIMHEEGVFSDFSEAKKFQDIISKVYVRGRSASFDFNKAYSLKHYKKYDIIIDTVFEAEYRLNDIPYFNITFGGQNVKCTKNNNFILCAKKDILFLAELIGVSNSVINSLEIILLTNGEPFYRLKEIEKKLEITFILPGKRKAESLYDSDDACTEPEEASKRIKACENCRYETEDHFKFCVKCGEKVLVD